MVALALGRSPTLGEGRLICIDGPAGAGKTTLAQEVATITGAPVVHLDDLYEGWDGLSTLEGQLDDLLLPLAGGRPGHYRRWDWHAGRWAESVTVEPSALLVLEGVGAGSLAHADLVTVLVWAEAPVEVRRRRALSRDGETFAPHWEAWAAAERSVFARDGARGRADLVLVLE